MTSAITATTRTHQGGHPQGNEDTGWVGAGAWAVADGMGGHVGGQLASATVVAAVEQVVGAATRGAVPTCEQARALAVEAVAQAGQALRARADGDEQIRSMGTTLVLAIRCEDEGADAAGLVVANVGDSRAYLLGPQGIVRLTRDDNVAEDMLAHGLIDAEQAATHPGQYRLTKALTAYDPTSPEPTITHAPALGRLLLCSDGLSGELGDATIGELLGRGDVEAAAESLLDTALRAPARDNVTVVVVDLTLAGG